MKIFLLKEILLLFWEVELSCAYFGPQFHWLVKYASFLIFKSNGTVIVYVHLFPEIMHVTICNISIIILINHYPKGFSEVWMWTSDLELMRIITVLVNFQAIFLIFSGGTSSNRVIFFTEDAAKIFFRPPKFAISFSLFGQT